MWAAVGRLGQKQQGAAEALVISVFLSFSPLPPLLHGLPLYQHWKVLFDQVCEQLNAPLLPSSPPGNQSPCLRGLP